MDPYPLPVLALYPVFDIERLAFPKELLKGFPNALRIAGVDSAEPELSTVFAYFLGSEAIDFLNIGADILGSPVYGGTPGDVGDIRDQRAESLLALPELLMGQLAASDVEGRTDEAHRPTLRIGDNLAPSAD